MNECLASKGKLALNHEQRRILARVLSGTFPMRSWMFARGAVATPGCAFGCGQPDTVGHRVWHCQHSQTHRDDLDPELVTWARERVGTPTVLGLLS